MDNVTFDSETDLVRTSPDTSSSGGLSTWLIQKKIAKDESQANQIFLGILAVCVLITGFALASLFDDGTGIDAAERLRLEQSTRPPQ